MADTIDKEQLGIVGSLFGVSPQQLQMAREQQAYTQGTQAGNNLLGGILGQSGMFAERAGAGLRGALGVQTPEEQLAGLRQQAQQQFDARTPEGLVQMAQFLNQQGDAVGAQQAIMLAQQRASTAQGIATSRAQQIRAEREPGQVNFQQLLSSGKYTPVSIAKFRDSQNPADLVLVKGLAGEGEGTGPGPVGKTGAYRDVDGNVVDSVTMRPIRKEFTEGQKLLKSLNDISGTDIKNAESYIDWTTKDVTKGLASSKTLDAQTKIAASQIMEQIAQLPPGSASDADMRAAMKSFPGYTDPEALRKWVNRTKQKLQDNIDMISNQFGFKQQVSSSGDVVFTKGKQTPQVSTSDADLISKYLKASPKQ